MVEAVEGGQQRLMSVPDCMVPLEPKGETRSEDPAENMIPLNSTELSMPLNSLLKAALERGQVHLDVS